MIIALKVKRKEVQEYLFLNLSIYQLFNTYTGVH